MKVLVCGGRDFNNKELLWQFLDRFHGISVIVHGASRGADRLAGEWAVFHSIPAQVFPAEWDRYGKSAGPIRNQQMIDRANPDTVIAFPGGRGTADMISRAKKAKIRVIEVEE
jgi:hypothetical protein